MKVRSAGHSDRVEAEAVVHAHLRGLVGLQVEDREGGQAVLRERDVKLLPAGATSHEQVTTMPSRIAATMLASLNGANGMASCTTTGQFSCWSSSVPTPSVKWIDCTVASFVVVSKATTASWFAVNVPARDRAAAPSGEPDMSFGGEDEPHASSSVATDWTAYSRRARS